MTGMFQSSSTASGSARLHASSAFSPSSASTISKSISSRMRRAIFRTTLESSTTRQVLISVSPVGSFGPHHLRVSGSGRRLRGEFEHAVDVEDDHQMAVEPVDTAGELGHAGIEIDGVFLAAVLGQPQHLADLVDQQAVGFA